MDTNAQLASMAERVKRGEVSPGIAHAAHRALNSSPTEFKARKLYRESVGQFLSNMLDAADLSPPMRERLLQFRREVERLAPTQAEWDAAITQANGGIREQ